MDRYVLPRPEHVDDESWGAIESHRSRLAGAIERDDRPAILGGCKELAECVARVMLVATGTTLSDNADFPPMIDTAQAALRMRPRELDSQPFVRVIAQSAATVIKEVNMYRNLAGTGHGRVRLADIDDPAVSVMIDATLLWCRWALEVLDPLLGSRANALITAVLGATSKRSLRTTLEVVDIPRQDPEDQHAIGVAFGQRAAGGFFNAYDVGIEPAERSANLGDWPIDYRRGVAEGLLLDFDGRIGLDPRSAKFLVRILQPLPPAALKGTLADLAARAEESTWAGDWEDHTSAGPEATVAVLREQGARLIAGVTEQVEMLCQALLDTERGRAA